jgi:hypothetical protein
MGKQACCPDCGMPVNKPLTKKDKVQHTKCKGKPVKKEK